MEVHQERSTSLTIYARLYDASLQGDVHSLNNLLQQDPLILERCTVQHYSNELGFYMQLPLHVAAHMGHLDVAKRLLDVSPSMCLANDQEGRKPIHVAASKGHVNVLQVLHQKNPIATRQKTNNGETVLHLCIIHQKVEALELLLNLTNDGELINSKDNDDNHVLHLAVATQQYED